MFARTTRFVNHSKRVLRNPTKFSNAFRISPTTNTASVSLRETMIPRQVSHRSMSIFTQKTKPLQSRLIVEETEPMSPKDKTKLSLILGGAAVVLGTVLFSGAATQSVDEFLATEDGRHQTQTYPTLVRERLFETYSYFAGGIAATAATAMALARSPGAVRFAAKSPMIFLIGSAVVSLGGMVGVSAVDKSNFGLKHLCYGAFVAGQGAAMLPIVIMAGPVVAQAASATAIMVGSLSAVAAVAPSDSFLWMGGGLTVGLGVVVASSLGRIFFPASSLLLNVSLYGGLTLFGGMTLYDTQRVAKAARVHTEAQFDPMRQSVSLYLNTINIFIRFVQIFAMSQGNNRRR
mmetsp:Transcript_9654/g.16310  ORF Transcript_9654/g.16310 Transcript_9654/m.16310 type:complete len:347 (+) Transcript_9654:48-1088(+)